MVINVKKVPDEDLWSLYSASIKELKLRNLIRSKNITGERGESLVINFYNKTKNLPKLQVAPVGTKNVDAISRDGERYSIKSTVFPNKTTGVFYGMGTPDKLINDKKFEYLVVALLDDDYNLLKIVELNWDTFIKFKKWHSRMNAFNVSLSKNLLSQSKVLFSANDEKIL